MKRVFFLMLLSAIVSCGNNSNDKSNSESKEADKTIVAKANNELGNLNFVWIHAKKEKTVEQWDVDFSKYAQSNIKGIIIGADIEVLERVIPIAHKYGIQVHAWMWTLNRNGDKEAQKHPEWYSVNRLGSSCFDHHPYVDYYQWVCPSIPEVQEHILNQVKDLLKIKGLDGIHLDYVRYSDAILPTDLWSTYNIVQDKVYPEWDYGYNPSNIALFKAKYGYSPLDKEDPNTDENWVKFRLNTVTELVNKIAEVVHSENKLLTAAVFPSPKMSSRMVYQSWSDWNLDAAMPMIYHNFYKEDLNWIGETTADGVKTLNGKFPIYTGLFVPNLKGKDLNKAIEISKKSGAKGVALFDAASFEKVHHSAIE
jgi:uncharacterized lipoprotein YddW (UPF0748 family)